VGDRWFSKSNIIALAAIAIGVVASLFGAAFSLPGGQRILCAAHQMFCRDVPVADPILAIYGLDGAEVCRRRRADAPTGSDPFDLVYGVPPGGRDAPPDAPCGPIDASAPEIFDQLVRLDNDGPVAPRSNRIALFAHLSFDHARVGRSVLFDVAVTCAHQPKPGVAWEPRACALAPPIVDPAAADPEAKASDRVRAGLEPDVQIFAQTWRLDIDGASDTSALQPGSYRVIVRLGGPTDLVVETRMESLFTVETG
jgi:hypothetical protein